MAGILLQITVSCSFIIDKKYRYFLLRWKAVVLALTNNVSVMYNSFRKRILS